MTASDPAVPPADLHDYGVLLRRQWWVLALAVLLGVVASAGYTATQPRVYTSVVDVLVTATGVEDDSVSASARTRAEINLDTEAQLLKSTAVLTLLREQLGSTLELDELGDRVSVSVPPNTEVLTIGFRGESPQAARDGADAVAVAYLANRSQEASGAVASRRAARQSQILALTTTLQQVSASVPGLAADSAERAIAEGQIQSLSAQIAILTAERDELDTLAPTPGRVITEASLPDTPSSPVLPMNLAGGALLGLLSGAGIALLRQRRDHQLHDAAQVEAEAGVSVLVTLPPAESPNVADPATAEGRAYVRLRNVLTARGGSISLDPGAPDSRLGSVIMVAGVHGDASVVATNLAVALSRTGAGVVVLVGTYPESRVGRRLGVHRRGEGLSEVLERPGRPSKAALRLVPDIPGLSVLLPGRDPDKAATLMQTELGADLLAALRESARYIVLDVPPTGLSSQAQSVATFSDAVLLVVTAKATGRADVKDAVDQFRSVGAHLRGAVLLPATRASGLRRLVGRRQPSTEPSDLSVVELAGARDNPADTDPSSAAPLGTASGGRSASADKRPRRTSRSR